MPESHKTFAIVTRDGIAVDSIPVGGELAYFHKHHSCSFSHAIEYEGYAIESREPVVRGWLAYLTISSRRGYGMDGAVLRTVRELHALLVERERMDDYIFSEHYLSNQLNAIEHGMEYLVGDAGIVRGEISRWVCDMRELYSVTE